MLTAEGKQFRQYVVSTPSDLARIVAAMAHIGDRIREAREAAGLSQTALAVAIGVTPSSISQLEAGRSKAPAAVTLVKLAHALRCSQKWLLNGTGRMDDRDFPVDDDEADLLIFWRQLSPAHQAALLATARALHESAAPRGAPEGAGRLHTRK